MRNIHSVLLRSIALAAATAGLACCATAPPAGSSTSHLAGTAVPRHTCIESTGSRIPPRSGQCLNAPGRSYSQQDIESTGAVSPAEALSLLDPSMTAH